MDRGVDRRGIGSYALTGAICGFIVAAVTHTIGLGRPHGVNAEEIRALFDTAPLLGYALYVVGGTVVGAVWGVIR